jgi:hypothetical protein
MGSLVGGVYMPTNKQLTNVLGADSIQWIGGVVCFRVNIEKELFVCNSDLSYS